MTQSITAIDSKIKEFENAESEKKRKQLDDFFWSLKPKEFIRLEDVLNPKWENKTATLEKLRTEISESVCSIENQYADLQNLYGGSPLWTAISEKFKDTKDKSKTLIYAAQIERQHSEEQKRAEEIRRQRETEEATRAESTGESMITGEFRVTGTREQIKVLAEFLKSNGICYEIIK